MTKPVEFDPFKTMTSHTDQIKLLREALELIAHKPMVSPDISAKISYEELQRQMRFACDRINSCIGIAMKALAATSQPAAETDEAECEEVLERCFWEFDERRKRTGEERLSFKSKMRWFASYMMNTRTIHAPAPADVVERLRGLLSLTPNSYIELAEQYAPGLAAAIKEIAGIKPTEPNKEDRHYSPSDRREIFGDDVGRKHT